MPADGAGSRAAGGAHRRHRPEQTEGGPGTFGDFKRWTDRQADRPKRESYRSCPYDMRPFLTWMAPDILKVTIAKAPMKVMALGFGGVHVDPDDAAIRAAVAEWRRGAGLPPERKDEAR